MAKDDKVILACSVCLSRNYTTSRKKNSTKRLELMKYCPKCGKNLNREKCDCKADVDPRMAALLQLLDDE